jgi:predicted dehydrogenase
MKPPSPLRVGLIGAGSIWNAHKVAFQQFPEHVRLVAVTDLNPDAARKAAEEFPGAAVCADPAALLDMDGLDAVLILTVHSEHAALALAALEAGKHVLVEKPMACDLTEAQAMVDAAEARNLKLMIGQCQRYDRSYRGVKRLISSGELGRIHAVRFDSMQGLFTNGLLPTGHWLSDGRKAGGGIVISVCVHRLDLVRFCLGEVRRVCALTRTQDPGFTHGAEDFATALLEFENGAIGEMFGTYSGFRMPYSEGLMIFGADGAIHAMPNNGEYQSPAFYASKSHPGVKDENNWLAQFRSFQPVPPDTDGLPTDNSFVNQMLHFADCCRTGEEPLSGGRDNLGTLRLIEGIYRSAESGAWVNLQDLSLSCASS